MHPILEILSGGDRRSIGRVEEVVEQVRSDPSLFEVLIIGMQADDPLVRMRCADAAEKISLDQPELLQAHKETLLVVISQSQQQEVRWHLAQMLPRLTLTSQERRAAAAILEGYLTDRSAIVRTFSLQGLADLAEKELNLAPRVTALLQARLETGSKAEQSRARKLLRRIGKLDRSGFP